MRLAFIVFALSLSGLAAAQSYAHNYERFFGKDDRIGLYSIEAAERFSPAILKTIQDNTLLMDCGSNGKPSTAFIAKKKDGPRIISAAHNLTMAEAADQDCKLGKIVLPKGTVSIDFRDNGTQGDAAYDIAYWTNVTQHKGFSICRSADTSAKYFLAQSLDGTGKLGLSPECKVKAVKGSLITSTCRGHYKASGAPLLAVSENDVCVAGVFNAHSGRLFEYESYAARLEP